MTYTSDALETLSSLAISIAARYSGCALITDVHVYSLYGKGLLSLLSSAGIFSHPIVLLPGEGSKSLLTASRCWEEMFARGFDRRSCVLGLGGGMVTDVAGFVASCYMRGIEAIHLPTTLLGMADAAIGGKTAVNLSDGKNYVGTFHPPAKVVVHTPFLQSLPEREFVSGLAEVIKYGVIRDPELFAFLETHMQSILARESAPLEYIVATSCRIKEAIVAEDPLDNKGVRALLNWGHTFGHAIEATTDYSLYTHGEAVAIGMSCAALVSQRLGHASPDFVSRLDRLLLAAGLPVNGRRLSPERLLHLMSKDKKAQGGAITLILAENVGTAFPVPGVPSSVILSVLQAKVAANYPGRCPGLLQF